MSESSSASGSKGISGWFKAAIASVLSAAGGAVLMYASPLLDTLIKPAKPVANFQAQVSGRSVTFQNKTTGGQEGWWDFGDGSAMEPFVPEEPAVSHVYATGGTYNVKLSVKNIIHDENDRVVSVKVDTGEPATAAGPSIDTFQVVPLGRDYAPASYRVITKVKNADMCAWVLGDRQIEFSPETANGSQERIVTFTKPGKHVLRLAAFNGKHAVEQTQTVDVNKAPVGMVTASVTVTYEAVQVEQRTTKPVIPISYPAQEKGATATVTHWLPADAGFEIMKADVAQPLQDHVKGAKVLLDPAKRDKVLLECEIMRPSGKSGVAPASRVHVALVQQRQSAPVMKTLEPVATFLTVPGSTLVPMPPLPAGWVASKHKVAMLFQQDGKQVGAFDGVLPNNSPLALQGGVYAVTAVEQGGQLQITVGGKGPVGVHGN